MSDTTEDGFPVAEPTEDLVVSEETSVPNDMTTDEQRRTYAIQAALSINGMSGIDKLLADSEAIEKYLRDGEVPEVSP